MRLVLAGATGFVGGAVLARLLAEGSVTHVTCLTRRSLGVADPRVTNVVLPDFARYEPSLAADLANHQGCIWALGGKATDIGTAELERVTHDFALSFARAVLPRTAGRFTLCYVSALGADRTETAWFPWERETRHLKGRTERDLRALAPEGVLCFRPGGILRKAPGLLAETLFGSWVIGLDELAHALVRAVVGGWNAPPDGIVSNTAIRAWARRP